MQSLIPGLPGASKMKKYVCENKFSSSLGQKIFLAVGVSELEKTDWERRG